MRRWHFFKYQLYFNDNFVRYEVEIAFQRQFLGEPSLKWIIQRWFWRTSLKLIFFLSSTLRFQRLTPSVSLWPLSLSMFVDHHQSIKHYRTLPSSLSFLLWLSFVPSSSWSSKVIRCHHRSILCFVFL